MIFDRKESIKQAIKDNSIDKNTIALMIDFYVVAGKLTEDDRVEFREMLYPTIPPAEEPTA